MQHKIPIHQFEKSIGVQIEGMTRAIESCVHCGFCLPTCPTYQILGEEMNSPRGRIFIMKAALEGDLKVEETLPYINRCLGCLACVTACPSGVEYEELLTPYRAYAQGQTSYSYAERLQRSLVHNTLPYPGRFRQASRLGKLASPLRQALPEELGAMLELLPERLPPSKPLPSLYPAEGERRARVAFLASCVQQVLAPELNWATLRVLAVNGVEVIIPQEQVCCGAILVHTGQDAEARKLAKQNLSAFPNDVDAILTNAAGCGSGMKSYGHLFKGYDEEEKALAFSRQVMDVSEFLDELGIQPPPALPKPLNLAFHDACHLAHAQGVTAPPRSLLGTIPNLTLVEIFEGDMCCGSAGTYNIEYPDIAGLLGQRKSTNILKAGGEAVVTGNIGCMVQIQNSLERMGKPLPVYHVFEVLDMAYHQRD
jgi:glycolate oxidase iron-sulfur subunit